LKYRTIVADPPWHYAEGFPSGVGRERRWTVDLPYSGMTVDEIKALTVASLAESDGARLFLWTTNKYLRAAFDVMEAWGFKYGQTITWHKTGCPSPFPTSIAPQHSEYLLYGHRGKPGRRTGSFPSSVVAAPQQTRHSAKPEMFIDLVEQVSPGPYVELFARRARFGWDYWGDESLGTAEVA
jgi:N6-adenosine-specific RNA methylase IME4